MNYLRDTAFVIKRINFSDADRYITLFTQNHGKQTLVAKGVRKITSKRAPHLELLNEVKFHAVKTRKNYVLTEVEILNTFSNLKKTSSEIGMIFLICELIDKLCPENQKHDDVFFLMQETLSMLEKEDKNDTMFNFEVKMLTLLGFWDKKRSFRNSEELENYIERIAERKIKSRSFLRV